MTRPLAPSDRAPSPIAGDLTAEPALAWRTALPKAADAVWARHQGTPAWHRWAAVLTAAIVSGPFAIGAALFENSTAGVGLLFLLVIFGPVTEEIVKAAGALVLAELRPWLVPAAWTLPLITLTAGLAFAAIENWWYLMVLIEEPSRDLVTWRWTLGPIVHGASSLIAGLGAARMWNEARRSNQQPMFHHARPYVIGAATLHGTFNLIALALERGGFYE